MGGMSSTLKVGPGLRRLKDKTDLHLTRKVWHFLGVIFIAVVFHNSSRVEALILSLGFFTLSLAVDLIRLRNEGFNRAVVAVMGPVMREREKGTYSGITALLLGTFLIVYIFPPKVVRLALLCLATADPLASYFGVKYGKDKLFKNKSLQGSAAAFVTCFIVGLGYFFVEGMMTDRILIASLLTGLFGSFSELINVGKMDDNLSFPVIYSTLLMVLFSIFDASI